MAHIDVQNNQVERKTSPEAVLIRCPCDRKRLNHRTIRVRDVIVMVTPGQGAGFSESGWWHLVQRVSEVEVLRFSEFGL
jgi:hypothetical protein